MELGSTWWVEGLKFENYDGGCEYGSMFSEFIRAQIYLQ